MPLIGKGAPGFPVLSATEAAMRSLARSIGAEPVPRGIRANAVSPGQISTPDRPRGAMSRR